MSDIKVDYSKIIQRLNDLKSANWVGSRKWWPHFIYHTTSIENAVSILSSGILLSRNKALKDETIARDIASSTVISQTDEKWKDYVRFYLRPKTPTLFINEGARPPGYIQDNAHCPTPVCFLFDAPSVLKREDCIFSNGNLGSSSVNTGTSADFFDSLPFEKIYHEGSFNPVTERDIVFHRCAEAIVPEEIDLSSLKHVVCRSSAEKDTLLNLLDWKKAQEWKKLVGVSTKYPLFNEKWNFVRDVSYTDSNIIVKFNEQTTNPRGPFKFAWQITELWDHDQVHRIEENLDKIPNDLTIKLNKFENKCLNFKIFFDDTLMFQNDFYHNDDMPF